MNIDSISLLNASEGKGKEALFYFSSTKVIRLTNLRPTMPSFYPLLPSPPSSPSVHSLTPLKATRKGKKSIEGFEVSPGNRTRDHPHKTLHTYTNQLQQQLYNNFYFISKSLLQNKLKHNP